MKVAITSDSHFNHHAIIGFERHDFNNIEEHNDKVISCWEDGLKYAEKTNGCFWFLGDFGRYSKSLDEKLTKLFSKYDCHKFAIAGNHDNVETKEYMKTLFDNVYNFPVFISKRIILSHIPAIQVDPQVLNIHGHLHGSRLNYPNSMNASVHVAEYKCIYDKDIERKLATLERSHESFLYEYYAAHYNYDGFYHKDIVCDPNGDIDLSASRLLLKLNN